MRTKPFLFAFLLCCFLGTMAFGQKKKLTPLQYNDQLAAVTDSLYSLGLEWGAQLQQIMEGSKNYGQLAAPRAKIAAFTEKKIAEIRRQPPVGTDGAQLKATVLDFLNFEKNMIETAFAPLEKLNSNTTQDEIDAAVKKLTDLASQEEEALKKVNVAQEAYGKSHGFELEPAEAEE
ncbi:hypothetical protein [Taibaiella koreensis]|uniref:hypothetical protein n=1 Tax=Taibaiella koreensis TaxID=1268548 RepID=UPI0013C37590|nr:hypothetical protein [Taibaiella koreensis]